MAKLLVIFYMYSIYLSCETKKISTLLVVGGENATDGEFPYMVKLYLNLKEKKLGIHNHGYFNVSLRGDNQYHTCGGTIIGSKWILTAGHCVLFGTRIRYGSVLLNEGHEEQTVKVKKQIRHPLWYEDVIPYNDLGLLELEESLDFNEYVQPIKLPDENHTIPFNQTGTLCGWGLMKNDTQTDHLQKVNLTLFYDDYCDSQLNIDGKYFISSICTCAGDWEHIKGQCTMDSGGPLIINGIQWGVVSWSYKPCGSLPGAFARLSNPAYRRWIRNTTGI